MMKMKTTTSEQSFFLISLLVVVVCSLLCDPVFCADGAPKIQEECSDEFGKVGMCLNYATGKAATPSTECCAAVKDIREDEPVCLCYIILETHKGTPSLKQMGLQEDKLLALPTACKLVDTSVDHCPKLLKLSPSSPDYAIFTNASSPAASKTSPTTPASSSSSTSTSTPSTAKNAGFKNGPVAYTTIFVLVAIFASLFP